MPKKCIRVGFKVGCLRIADQRDPKRRRRTTVGKFLRGLVPSAPPWQCPFNQLGVDSEVSKPKANTNKMLVVLKRSLEITIQMVAMGTESMQM